jgi:hypothetical protein
LILSANGLSRNQFHDEKLLVVGFFQSVYAGNVRMIQRGEHSGFTLEASNSLRITSKGFGENLDRHATAQLGVGSLVYISLSLI